MASKDEFTLYGSMEHATFEFQRVARQRLWEIQVARVLAWVADEEFDAWEQEFDPQVRDCYRIANTVTSLPIGQRRLQRAGGRPGPHHPRRVRPHPLQP